MSDIEQQPPIQERVETPVPSNSGAVLQPEGIESQLPAQEQVETPVLEITDAELQPKIDSMRRRAAARVMGSLILPIAVMVDMATGGNIVGNLPEPAGWALVGGLGASVLGFYMAARSQEKAFATTVEHLRADREFEARTGQQASKRVLNRSEQYVAR